MSRAGDWIMTYTGVEFWPLDPRPEEIRIEDIAHSLSMQCRYSGHSKVFYSVAEHAIRVSELCPPEYAMWGLLHDAAEAYLVDLPRPLKRHSEIGRLYRESEDRLMMAICEKFGLDWQNPAPEPVERADKAMLYIESRCLMPAHQCWDKWSEFATGDENGIDTTMPPEMAEQVFLSIFYELKENESSRSRKI
jgi:5'-deoxynucleotidase YfbR-like HD superfamily hydrolase